ncbi:MAG: BatA domain-containing protein [Planctomycetaceae bacterium]
MGFFSSLSFLAPLYVVAGLTVGLPILFHLIRRTPRGRRDFSSTMFLQPSPPRITRRSRLDNWLLLLLRAAAVLLLVAAFCRPLWRHLQAGDAPESLHDIIILLDTSASLRRTGVWDEARAAVEEQVRAIGPNDSLELLTFDDATRVLMPATEWRELEATQRIDVALDRLSDLEPGWGASNLGDALIEAADRLEQAAAAGKVATTQQVFVVSDLQQGSRWEPLQRFEWPANVTVEFIAVGAQAAPTNAGLQIVGRPEVGDQPFVRVRVSNAANSERETFQVGWRDPLAQGGEADKLVGAIDVYVPSGQSRVVRMPRSGDEGFTAGELRLTGDDQPFDNQAFVAWPKSATAVIGMLGDDDSRDRNGLRFFVEPLFPSTPARAVRVLDDDDAVHAMSITATEPASLVIVSGKVTPGHAASAAEWLAGGGTVLLVCDSVAAEEALRTLTGVPLASLTEADVADYAMLREVDFDHPVFAPLDDPRYADVSKVHFWHYRRLDVTSLTESRVLATYESGDPALVEVPRGHGRLYILTSGWQRADSQLATWPKFVTIMNALLATTGVVNTATNQLVVGDAAPSAPDTRSTPASLTSSAAISFVRQSDTGPVAVDALSQPGLYRAVDADEATGARDWPWAVNLPADESQTAPLPASLLESLGLSLTSDLPTADEQQRQGAQLARVELEGRQRLWRWLLLAVLVLLVAETLLAARRPKALAAPRADE